MPIEDQSPRPGSSEKLEEDIVESLRMVRDAANRSKNFILPIESETTQTGTTVTKLSPEWREALSKTGEANPRFRRVIGRIGATGLGLALLIGAGGVLKDLNGGSNSPEQGEIISVNSVTFNENATFRTDPYVPDGDPNIAFNNPLTSPLEVDVSDSTIRITDDENKEWFGFPKSIIEDNIPNTGNINDKDNVIWVNWQGLDDVEKPPENEQK